MSWLKPKKQTDSSQSLVESPQESRPNIWKRFFPSSRSTSPANSRPPSPLPPIYPSTFDPSGKPSIPPGSPLIAPSDKGTSSSSAPEPSTVGVNKHKYALPPFEPFTLSVDTLRGLHKWNERNQNNRLAAVLEQVTGAIESKGVQLALEMIPNDPFPVGTLVKGLVGIAVYEMQILSRKQQAHDFAMDRVNDLEAIADAFGTAPPDSEDPLILQCWADLTPFCTITNDICKWARNQITSNQASDEEQQTEFKDQLADANMLFLKLATIRAMRAISGIGEDVVKLLRYNDRIAQLKWIKATLGSHIATGYQYDVQDKEKCHEGTREGVLKELDAWIRDDNAPKRCWWLTGTAGIGKTAIAMSAVQRFMGNQPLSEYSPKYDSAEDAPVLYAQYFCNHNLKSTSTVNNIFPTLTMQLAESSPAAAHIIYGVLQKDKTLAHELSQKQAEYLFFAPLCKVANSAPATKFVVVIDGVDEFAEAVHGKITSILKQVTMSLRNNVRLLILSRPETAIMKHIPSDHIRHRDLPTEESFDDVQEYFNTIVWDEESTEFPTATQLELLCISASGHLGWANQAVAWLQGQLKYRDSNSSEFKDDFRRITQIAGGNLDTLYSLILERYLSATDERTRPSVVIGLRNLLGCLFFLHESYFQSIGVIRALVSSNSGFDVLKSLKRLGSLYDIGTEPTLTTIPRPPHKSFFDYLISSRAPDEFRISEAAAHRELASACFRIMKENLHFNMGGFDSPRLATSEARLKVSSPTLYACSSFAHHVQQSGGSFVEETSHWLNVLFLFWLEVIVLSEKPMDPKYYWIESTLETLQNHLEGDSELSAAMDSARLAISIFHSMLTESVATIYTTILLFVHDSSLIANYRQSSPHICSLHNTQGASESYAQRPGAFSSDGNLVAIATEDTLSVLSSLGTVLWTKPAKSRPNRLSLSPTGHVLACTYGQTVQCFRIASGEAPMKEVNITDGELWDLKISPDGEYIAGISCKLQSYSGGYSTRSASVYIIRIEDGTVTWQGEIDPESDSIDSVQFLPDNTLANVYGDGRLVDARRGKILDGFMFDREKIGQEGIRHITASLDGSLLAVVSRAHVAVISIWTTQPERFVTTLAVDSESYSSVECTAFSSDGTLLISGHNLGAVLVWQCDTETKTWSCITSLYGHWDVVKFVAFLPGHGNKRVVSHSTELDPTFRIWDISAAVEGREFEIEVDEGTPAEFGAWFRHAIPLGGWLGMVPFVCKFPFKLPAGVEPLDWDSGGSEGWKRGWTLEEIRDIAYDWEDDAADSGEESLESV